VGGLKDVRVKEFLSIDDAAAFHGHKGPFLVIGYRVGECAVKKLQPEDEFDLITTVFIPLKTPYSCIIDGLQCSTKCTLGKWNIKWVESNEFKVIVENKKKGKKLEIWLSKKTIEEAEKCQDIATFSKKLEKESIESIIERIEEN